ncbi:senescence-associated protein-domain-containing protein [Naematelia encephala]|uniref:Senescence-associated protein-domain-containing protein n=1 Tax=Naematelia encephala TaxID=71784 RepID=A0A1Y2ARI6_9TREE|nr:senescence-associated protein-domain-containing protein [Naematelia encephala]
MTTLIAIPATRALHIPKPGAEPIPLSSGELVLTLIPANPPAHPSSTLTLSIGTASFPLLPNSPVQKTETNHEHSTYVFKPVPADGGAEIGQVRIFMKDSHSQGEWEATQALCAKFEATLKEHGVWEEKTLFVDDEYETAGQSDKTWGETIASTVTGLGHALAERLGGYTDKHITETDPVHPPAPSGSVENAAASTRSATNTIAEVAESGALKVGELIHEGGKKAGAYLPDSIAKSAEPVAEADKSDYRKMAEGGWEQVTIAAKGIASATEEVATALSENAHRAVEHNFGKEAEGVAQNVGQAGANIGATTLSGLKATSAIVQGGNAASGVANSRE